MRTCKACKKRYEATRPMQQACSVECAMQIANKKRSAIIQSKIKEDKRADRERKVKLKTRSDYIKEAQVAFNRYIRLRDAGKLCICCSMPLGLFSVGGAYDCGHYRSVGSAPHLRFDERNAHAQRKQCNRHGAGRAVDYRRGLVERYGVAYVEDLERDQSPKHYTIEDLKAIKTKYRALTKALTRGDAA